LAGQRRRQNIYDVAIIGGGPAGSTAGTLLKKYAPQLNVVILEREIFPRDHVGESMLPMINLVLQEMGCWDKVEAADFPIKIGATYRWGRTDDLWDFDFLAGEKFEDKSRPSPYQGQRLQTAFQVDRSIYDKILLDHAQEIGCEVRQSTKVVEVRRDGDRITALLLEDGSDVTARYYLDASGSAGILRRAVGVEVDSPTSLRNIAIWDYWQNADWAVEIGVGGTRIQVMSLGWGWLWFIPLGPMRTSVGLVVPADYYKSSGKKPAELYQEALAAEPRISDLLANARSENKLATTRDWSFLASRMVGENWFLAGESAGFADPILSAGMTLAHTAAREVAYTILELDRGALDRQWLLKRYEESQQARIRAHIQFADFWYCGNGIFTDLQKYTSEIASTAGLKMDADEAFRWLSTGGFANDSYQFAQVGTWDVTAIKLLAKHFTGKDGGWDIGRNNVFDLRLEGSERDYVPILHDGQIQKVRCYTRNGKTLPNYGDFLVVIRVLRSNRFAEDVVKGFHQFFRERGHDPRKHMPYMLQTLEAMVAEGWVEASHDPSRPSIPIATPDETDSVHPNRDYKFAKATAEG
jgi:flavin-dependent dehydrogenase